LGVIGTAWWLEQNDLVLAKPPTDMPETVSGTAMWLGRARVCVCGGGGMERGGNRRRFLGQDTNSVSGLVSITALIFPHLMQDLSLRLSITQYTWLVLGTLCSKLDQQLTHL
jgi:hypothetical protein